MVNANQVRALALQLLPPIIVTAIRSLRHGRKVNPPVSAVTATAAVQPPAEPAAQPAVRKYWGLRDLDEAIEKYIGFDSGYFVELGANDGRLASNTFHYEQFRNWRGVLIEPAPNLFLQCRANRSAENHVICAACVSFDYCHEFVRLVYSNSMSVSLNVETDIGDPKAHAELGRQFLRPDETVFEFGAVARTLNSILLEANAPRRIDFLSLDVEGAEIEVLKGVDHEVFRFRYMLIECRDIDRLSSHLTKVGYKLLEKFNEHDYLFADAA
jgi:FkbM family methyltransferase